MVAGQGMCSVAAAITGLTILTNLVFHVLTIHLVHSLCRLINEYGTFSVGL